MFVFMSSFDSTDRGNRGAVEANIGPIEAYLMSDILVVPIPLTEGTEER